MTNKIMDMIADHFIQTDIGEYGTETFTGLIELNQPLMKVVQQRFMEETAKWLSEYLDGVHMTYGQPSEWTQDMFYRYFGVSYQEDLTNDVADTLKNIVFVCATQLKGLTIAKDISNGEFNLSPNVELESLYAFKVSWQPFAPDDPTVYIVPVNQLVADTLQGIERPDNHYMNVTGYMGYDAID